ncbi:MAG: glycoside hydrolase family 18 protein [Candidatus Sulfotelmatobacter sp.]
MPRQFVFLLTLGAALVLAGRSANAQTQIQIYGAWHCGSDFCTWSSVRDMTDFDTKNHWMIDRGDGSGLPSVNLVVLSFVQPLKLLDKTNDSQTVNGVPIGMTSAIVSYFTSHNIRVMLSIGGATYTTFWDQALTQNATQLGLNAAAVAKSLGVGIEIDYENSSSPNISGLQAFINAYRSQLPYDATGANPAARLTIDLAAGDRYLIGLCQEATANWLLTSSPILDYANAMVPSKQPSTSAAESNWQEHVDGKPQYSPPIGPLAPSKFTGSVFIVTGRNPAPECTNFSASLENSTGT